LAPPGLGLTLARLEARARNVLGESGPGDKTDGAIMTNHRDGLAAPDCAGQRAAARP
jgi:hypothetical protein